ncbi:hypothetical protein ACOI1C_04145 [Bacillus sp. DJP31]|uniref:hypothetical protein n=1 Tax=Bacillus sp. DJP31 TaxID=3409789 RepID=UPI003BB6CB75
MRKRSSLLFFVTLLLSLMLIDTKVSATSWVELTAQEVSNRAEVIVMGSYDFSSEPKQSDLDFIFQGLMFNVESVYKGEISKQFTAGIDHYDVGWAEEFQGKGGKFLLFLEKSENADFLIPVGGPNGMIHISNGKVVDQSVESRLIYEGILKNGPKSPNVVNKHEYDHHPQPRSNTSLYVSAAVLVGIIALNLIYRNKRRI